MSGDRRIARSPSRWDYSSWCCSESSSAAPARLRVRVSPPELCASVWLVSGSAAFSSPPTSLGSGHATGTKTGRYSARALFRLSVACWWRTTMRADFQPHLRMTSRVLLTASEAHLHLGILRVNKVHGQTTKHIEDLRGIKCATRPTMRASTGDHSCYLRRWVRFRATASLMSALNVRSLIFSPS
jgi:hypothetical protein